MRETVNKGQPYPSPVWAVNNLTSPDFSRARIPQRSNISFATFAGVLSGIVKGSRVTTEDPNSFHLLLSCSLIGKADVVLNCPFSSFPCFANLSPISVPIDKEMANPHSPLDIARDPLLMTFSDLPARSEWLGIDIVRAHLRKNPLHSRISSQSYLT